MYMCTASCALPLPPLGADDVTKNLLSSHHESKLEHDYFSNVNCSGNFHIHNFLHFANFGPYCWGVCVFFFFFLHGPQHKEVF